MVPLEQASFLTFGILLPRNLANTRIGKSVLASLVVEEARNLTPKPVVLFFYFKHGNSERDNFPTLARSLLAQLLKQDQGLLLYFYEKCCDSGEVGLITAALVEELLTYAFSNCKRAYIILDGLDECIRKERKIITQWFRKLVDDLPPSEPERLRCLFISQDDGIARKDFTGLASIKVGPEDTKHDIDEYSRIKAGKLKGTFSLSDEEVSTIASTVAESVGGTSVISASDSFRLLIAQLGMFLLAELIWRNLSAQVSVMRLKEELRPNNFPENINDA
jgi:hypothetical protein